MARARGTFLRLLEPVGPQFWRGHEDDKLVRDLIKTPPTVVNVRTTARAALHLAAGLHLHSLPVVGFTGEPLGLVCACDLTRALPNSLVADAMVVSPATISPNESLEKAADVMRDFHVACLLVVENGRVVGLITREDLLNAGALLPVECPRCTACQSPHHIRVDVRTGFPLCISCMESARSADFDLATDDEVS